MMIRALLLCAFTLGAASAASECGNASCDSDSQALLQSTVQTHQVDATIERAKLNEMKAGSLRKMAAELVGADSPKLEDADNDLVSTKAAWLELIMAAKVNRSEKNHEEEGEDAEEELQAGEGSPQATQGWTTRLLRAASSAGLPWESDVHWYMEDVALTNCQKYNPAGGKPSDSWETPLTLSVSKDYCESLGEGCPGFLYVSRQSQKARNDDCIAWNSRKRCGLPGGRCKTCSARRLGPAPGVAPASIWMCNPPSVAGDEVPPAWANIKQGTITHKSAISYIKKNRASCAGFTGCNVGDNTPALIDPPAMCTGGTDSCDVSMCCAQPASLSLLQEEPFTCPCRNCVGSGRPASRRRSSPQCPCAPSTCSKTWTCMRDHHDMASDGAKETCNRVFDMNGPGSYGQQSDGQPASVDRRRRATYQDEVCCIGLLEKCAIWQASCFGKMAKEWFPLTNWGGVVGGAGASLTQFEARLSTAPNETKLAPASLGQSVSLDESLEGKRSCKSPE